MKINKNNIANIRNKIKISEIISNFVNVKKKGQNYLCICPFHDDKHPSLVINDNKNIFKCFSCGVSGDAFSFVSKYKNINYYQAIIECSKISNLDNEIINSAIKLNDEYSKNFNYYEINKFANKFFNKFIKTPNAEKAINYLHKRKFTDEDILKFEIGWAPEDNIVFDLLINKDNCASGTTNFKDYEIEMIGLSKNNNLFFKNRITFPIYDENDNIVGFSGRSINDIDEPKYLNSPESLIFHKTEILFNLNNVIKDIETESIYIVEGFMDVFALKRMNINNVVATMGVAFSKSHLDLLISKLPNLKIVNVFFDNDEAGISATDNILKILNNKFIIFVAKYLDSNNKDIDQIYNTNEKLAFDVVNNLISSEKYQIEKLIKKYEPFNESKKVLFIDNCIDILKNSKNEVAIDDCINSISTILNINKEIIINKIVKKQNISSSRISKINKYKYNYDVDIDYYNKSKILKEITIEDLEKTIIQFFLIDKNYIDLFPKKRFINERNETILNAILHFYATHNVNSIEISDLKNVFDDEEIIANVSALLIEIEKNKIIITQKALEQTIDTYLKKLNKRWQSKQLEKIKNVTNPEQIINESINRNKKK